MNAREIQQRLIVERYRRGICVPNYTPKDWWECDVFELTPAGYFREYEIKMTVADFRADAATRNNDFKIGDGVYPIYNIDGVLMILNVIRKKLLPIDAQHIEAWVESPEPEDLCGVMD
jgi:hypothetical protein